MMNENLMKLDELADELLEKSLKKSEEEVEPKESEDKDLKAKDVVEDEKEVEAEDESDAKEDEKEVEKSTETEVIEEPVVEDVEKSTETEVVEDVEKSVETEVVEEPTVEETVEKSVDNSRAFADAIEVLHKSITDMGSANNTTDGILAKSLISLINANSSLKEENHALNERLDNIEKSMGEKFDTLLDAVESMANQPANMRKSMKNVHVHDRDFAKSLNGNVNKFDSLSKSEVLGILNDELYNNNPSVTVSDVIGFESGAPLRPELKALVENKVK